MARIRTATVSDVPGLVALGHMMHAESRYREFEFNPVKYATVLRKLIPQGLTFVAEEDGALVGAFVGRMESHFFGDEMITSDLLVYVVPAHRGRLGVQLIREYKSRAMSLGIRDIYLGISAGILLQRTERLYEREGFHRIGGSYILEV